MARLESFIIFSLLILSNNELCQSEDPTKTTLKWVSKVVELGMTLHGGNPIKIGLAMISDAQELIDEFDGKKDKSDEKLTQVSTQLESLTIDVKNVQERVIDELSNAMNDIGELKDCLNNIYSAIEFIEDKYTDYRLYMKNMSSFENDTLLEFANTVTDQGAIGLQSYVNNLHKFFYEKSTNNTGETVLSVLSSNKLVATQKMCRRKQSLQQMLYILYNTIVLANIKGYTMIQAGFRMKRVLLANRHGYASEINLKEQRFISQMENLLTKTKAAMKTSPRTVWTCNLVYKEDVTYTKFNNLFSNHILNEQSLAFNYLSNGWCINQCDSWYTTFEETRCEDDLCKKQKKCDGKFYDCTNIKESASVCLSSSNVNRNYDYIELGTSEKSCSGKKIQADVFSSFFDSCNYCMCTCDRTKNKESDRFVNLRPVVANTEQNYVVTGLKFEKKNHVLHIRIKEGQLLPGGAINVDTNKWKPIEAYEIGKPIPGTNYVPTENIDYHQLQMRNGNNKTWTYNKDTDWTIEHESEAIFNLDDVGLFQLTDTDRESFKKIMNPDKQLYWHDLEPHQYHVVTGVQISRNHVEMSGTHLSLELFMTPFNFTSGKMHIEKSFWHSKFNQYTDNGFFYNSTRQVNLKDQIVVKNLDLPTNSQVQVKPTSEDNQFVKLSTSSLASDGGQTTIPFIDTTLVETNPPTPLAGAGLMLKTSPGTGGYLALKLFTFDYEPFIKIGE